MTNISSGECRHIFNVPDVHGAVVCRKCGFISGFTHREAPTSKDSMNPEWLRASGRGLSQELPGTGKLLMDAADEIERLRAQVSELSTADMTVTRLAWEHERFKAALTILAKSRHIPPVERQIVMVALSGETGPKP